jgi:hypothetical protein
MFVFVAEQSSRFPATILSRLVRVPFLAVPHAEIEKALKQRGLSADEAARIAKISRGRPGWALHPPERSPWPSLGDFFSTSSVGQRFELIERVVKACESSEDALEAWSLALNEWEESGQSYWTSYPQEMLILAHGLVLARRLVGGAIPPRMALESATVKIQQFTSGRHSAILSSLVPQHLSSSIPMLLR